VARIDFAAKEAGGQTATGSELNNALVQFVTSTVDPTINDDDANGLPATTVWLNTTSGVYFISVDGTPGAAVWSPINDSRFCSVYAGASTTLTTATWTVIGFDTVAEESESTSMLTPGAGLTIPASWNGRRVSGVAQLQIQANTGKSNQARARLSDASGTRTLAMVKDHRDGSNTNSILNLSLPPRTVATGDYYFLEGYQNSGGSIGTATGQSLTFMALWTL